MQVGSQRWGRPVALSAIALAIGGVVAASAQTTEPVTVTPNKNRHGTVLKVDGNPSALSGMTQSPTSIALFLPRGMRFDTVSRKKLCKAEEAADLRCPRESRIGFGHTIVHLTGYLFPGGETDAVSTFVAFLGEPVQTGDRASLVLQIKLQPEEVVRGLQEVLGSNAPRTESSIVGRFIPVTSGPYGLEVRFDGFPGGFSVPAPLTARVTRFKIALGAIRELKKTYYITRRVTDINRKTGKPYKRTIRIKDHRLISHHLFKNPRTCLGAWPYALRVGFPTGVVTHTGSLPCRSTKKVSRLPPETPSAPQRD